jgi:cysteine synthase
MAETMDIRTLAATRSWGRGRIYEDITETIGHTPLVRLARMGKTAQTKAEIR